MRVESYMNDDMNEDRMKELAKQIMELSGSVKDGAIRLRTGVDNHSHVLAKISQQLDRLNDNLERLVDKKVQGL